MSINTFTEYNFSIPVTVVDFDGEELQELLDEIVPVTTKHRQGPLNKPWNSSNVLATFDWDAPVRVNVISNELPKLKSHILRNMNQILVDLDVQPMYSFVDLDESWINYSAKGMFQEFHMHPGADWSGVFYVAANEDSGNIIFTTPSPSHHFHELSHRSSKLYPQISYTPRVGRMIFFPSYLEHQAVANNSDEERVSIAFNIKMVD